MQSYLRTAELQKVAYNTRTLVLLNAALLTNYLNYTGITGYVDSIKNGLTDSLNTIYTLQNEINLSQLPISDEQD
jgi:hypothetical protein